MQRGRVALLLQFVVVARWPIVVGDMSAFSATMRSGIFMHTGAKSADMTRDLLKRRRLSCPSARAKK